MIAIPIQADAAHANVVPAASSSANAGSLDGNVFAQALLSAAGPESQAAAKTAKLTTDPGLGIPNPEEEQKNAEAILALNLAAPGIAPPVIEPETVMGPVTAAPTAEPVPECAGETSEGTNVQPLVSEDWGGSAGGAAKQVRPLPGELNAVLAATPADPSNIPDWRSPGPSPTTEASSPPLTASTQPPAAYAPQATPSRSAGSTGVCGADTAPSPPSASIAEKSAASPKLAAKVSASIPWMESTDEARPQLHQIVSKEVPALPVVEAQGELPTPQTGVPPRPADAVAEVAAPVSIQPELQKPAESSLRTVLVGHVLAGVATGHPVRELRLPNWLHRATVISTQGQAAEKPKADDGGPEIHGPRISSSQSQTEAAPADTAVKMPEDSAGREAAAAAPPPAAPNPHVGEPATSPDGGIAAVPPSPPSNQSIADSGTPSPAMKTRTPSPTDSAPNLLPSTAGVNVARIVDRIGQSEMHIGLRTLAFGSVEVHTVVRDSQVGLAVGSERGDLRSFLTAEVPGLQTTFHQHDLRFDNIRFLDQGPGFDMGFSAGADSQSRSFQQGGKPAPGWPGFGVSPTDSGEVELAGDARTGLNVHA